jgi:hypothetical protein
MIQLVINSEEHQILQRILLQEEQRKKEVYLQDQNGDYKLIATNWEVLSSVFDRLTELLQKEGFDIDYNPTYLGRTLEGLIDKISEMD